MGSRASLVVGQPDFTSDWSDNPSEPTIMSRARDVAISDGKLFVADQDQHRVLIWNSIPSENGQLADIIIGQDAFLPATSPPPEANPTNPQESRWRVANCLF